VRSEQILVCSLRTSRVEARSLFITLTIMGKKSRKPEGFASGWGVDLALTKRGEEVCEREANLDTWRRAAQLSEV
jgi:hypothetical protein